MEVSKTFSQQGPAAAGLTMGRRQFGLLMGTGAAAIAGAGGAQQAAASAHETGPGADTSTLPGYEGDTGHAIYHLPRDHVMHGGAWYRGAEYQETHYFTGFFTDRNTGRPYSVFFCWASYGWDNTLGRPGWNALFSMVDLESKRFFQCVQPMQGTLAADASRVDVEDEAFFANYALKEDALRVNSPDGQVAGHGFIEFMSAPFDSPLGKDIPYDPEITARRDGHMPDAPDFRAYTGW